MAKYIAIWRQEGGCDYTIGCGIAVHHFEIIDVIEADSRAAAIALVAEQLSSLDLDDETANSITQVDIVEYVGDFAFVMPAAWTKQRAERKAAKETSAKEKKERAEYDRLRKKFGGK